MLLLTHFVTNSSLLFIKSFFFSLNIVAWRSILGKRGIIPGSGSFQVWGQIILRSGSFRGPYIKPHWDVQNRNAGQPEPSLICLNVEYPNVYKTLKMPSSHENLPQFFSPQNQHLVSEKICGNRGDSVPGRAASTLAAIAAKKRSKKAND